MVKCTRYVITRNCPNTFYRHFKTHYFPQAFSSPYCLPPCSSDSAFADIVRVYKFYLLTYLLTYLLYMFYFTVSFYVDNYAASQIYMQ